MKAEAEKVGRLGHWSQVFDHSYPPVLDRSKGPKRVNLKRGHNKSVLLSRDSKWVRLQEDRGRVGRRHETENPQTHPWDFVKCHAWLHDAITQEAPDLCCHSELPPAVKQAPHLGPCPHWILLTALCINSKHTDTSVPISQYA